ncbi:midasin-like [Centruroides sculpturatus]|uniref:midasin-like n=1 Tax=Centruroides sculpturatus TaxID=218467 RepID=UPI000C6C9A92|nr:midasin-like [Centruroides sculpturatus]
MFKTIADPTDCEVHSVIWFLNAKNVKSVEIHRQLVEIYDENVMSDGMVRKWVRQFNAERTDVHDEAWSGWPSVVNDGLIAKRDLTRHLDKISKDLEKICKNILWSTLSSENYSKNEIKYLFESWNAYHHLCFKLPPSRTNEEIKVFQNKIDALWKIINCLNKLLIPNIISPTIYEELNFIKNSLTTVEESLKSSGVVSSGGRFEWIDSILVTAIKKGYWLLIDDVNFCSPSVLDRLNGLLEPNGVLTLSELGVIGEEVPVITPHPNFRLIFAMNPKNGEISPAMRNRGIEIYIPGEADGHNFDDFDLYTLLQCKGLNDSLIISDLLCTHKMILEEYSGNQIEVPTVLELLQTTSLCVQLLQCGYHPENAFIESCNTVYVKGILNHFVKQKIEMCFKELISGFSTLHNYSDTNILSSLMPSALEFYMDPILARLKQESILCNCLLYNVENNNKMNTFSSLKIEMCFKELISGFSTLHNYSDTNILSSLMPSALEFYMDPILARLKQESILCNCLLYNVENNNKMKRIVDESMEDFTVDKTPLIAELPFSIESTEDQIYLICCVAKMFIETSTICDFSYREFWIQQKVSHLENKCEMFQNVSSHLTVISKYLCTVFESPIMQQLYNYLQNFSNSDKLNDQLIDDMLLDIRWNTALQKKIFILSKENQDLLSSLHSFGNRFQLFLHYQLFRFIQDTCIHTTKQNRNFSLANLSKAFIEGRIIRNDLSHSVIQFVLPLLCEIDKEILLLLNQRNYLCKTTDLWKIIEAIRYYHYFVAICYEICTKQSIKHQLSLLILHWRWIEKRFLPYLFNENSRNESENCNLKIIVNDIKKALEPNISRMHELKLKSSKYLSFCVPIQDEIAASVFIDIQRLSKTLNIYNYIKNSNQQLISVYLYGSKWMEQLQNCLAVLTNSDLPEHINKAKDMLKVIEIDMSNKKLLSNQNMKLSEICSQNVKVSCEELTFHVQLSPMMDYIYVIGKQKLLYHTLCDIHITVLPEKLLSLINNKFNKNVSRCSEELLCKINKENILYPIEYVNEYGIFQKNNAVISLLLNFFTHLKWSPTSAFISEFLTWNICDTDLLETLITNRTENISVWKKEGTFMQPVRFFIFLMLQNDFDSVSFTVRNYFAKSEQLKKLNSLLWKNALDFCHNAPSFKLVNALVVIVWFNYIAWCLLSEIKKDVQHVSSLDELHSLLLMIDFPSDFYNIVEKTVYSIKELYQSIMEGVSEFSLQWILGKASAYVGLLTFQLFIPRDIVDPIQKWKIKLHYFIKEHNEISMELKLRNIYSEILTGMKLNPTNECHPVISYLLERKDFLKEKKKELKKKIFFRPNTPQYEDLLQDVHHFLSSVGSANTMLSMLEQLDHVKEMCTVGKDKDVMKLEKVLREIERWQKSEDSFSNKLQEKYLLYGDLIIPFLAGLKQMAFGVQTAANYVSSQLFKLQFSQDLISIEKFFIKLLEFPYVSISYNEDLSPAYFLSQSSTISFFESLLNYVFKENSFIVQENITKLIMSGLIELKNEILLTKGDDLYALRVFKLLSKFLNVIFNVWHQQETEQKRKEEEEQALYEYRISQKLGSLSEEQQQKLEIKELFPSYEEEFNVKEDDDLKNSSDPSDPEQNIYSHPNNITFSLKHQDMIDIWSIHATIVSILSNKSEFPYISQFHSNGKYDLKRLEYIQPFMLRYEVVQYLVKDIGQNLDSMLDGYTINSNLLTNFATQNVFKQLDNTWQKDFDVYHNCNPSESIQCQIILKKLTEKLHSLLEQFPDHPTLKQVLKIIDRILSFPVTSPLMKFVTGFELILTVSQDWEINAHKGVSLINELSEITEKIISWRKLELRCWSGCLDSLYNKAYSNCAKWWFYLYSVISPIIGDGNLNEEKWPDETRDNFIGTLQQFVEHSTVGEFQARIDLLYTFMEHIKHYLSSHSQADLCNILSNIYYYYHQFVISVHEKISTDRKVIEKEIKEFIKIIRWSDINFWAVKQQVEKSHQTLHKHMKQYEKVLNQSAQPYFELCKNVELEEEIKMERSELNCSDFISALTLQQYLGNSSSQIEFCQDYYKKMRNLCKKIYKASKIFENINFLEDFAGEIITSAHDLQLLNVSKDADEERRKKEIRSIRLQKQKGLSDLFKALTSVGLSFKLGTVYWKDINIKNLLSLSFFDVETALNSMVYERKGDKIWKHNSKRIHNYFYRSIFKFFSLATALESPNKDLSPDNIERCKGFIGHLLYLICNQQQQIKENVESILNIRNLLNNLKSQAENFQDVHEMLLPSQDILEKWMINMKNLAYRTTTSLQQFIIILECCPDKVENSYILSNSDSLPSLILANKNDDMWIQIYDKANESLKTIQNLINQFPNKSLNSLYTFKDYEFISNAFKVFIELSLNFKLLKKYIEADDKINNFSSSLNFILDEIRRLELDYEKCIFQFRQKCSNLCNGNVSAIDELNSSVKQINHHVLLAVQNIFQYHSKTDEDSKKDENASTSEKVLTNGVIKEIKDIMNILNFLKIKKLSRKIGKHLKLIDSSKVNIEEANKVIFAILPFLDQYVNLAQFFIVEQTASHSVLCKLLYVLLGIFNDLAKQGFCLPPELLEENVQKKGDKFKEIEDGGFGEGEGMKDVSENLESEDQLEDAHKPGEKKQDELDQPECEEEEHGVEMSEDFEGKLHDPSKTDNSSDNNEDDNDDEDNLEKKMGDINEEENIEKLDNEIWGSDNENEDDELKDDNSGKGKALPEENIVAKDDNIEERNDDGSKENQPHSEVTDHHDDEYDGEHANEVNEQTKQVPESFDIPDDLHIEEESAMEIAIVKLAHSSSSELTKYFMAAKIIWGSDNENEDDELKDDNSGKGKALPEENIAAKDDNIEERNDDESKENQPHSEVTDHHDDEYDGEHANEVNEQTKQKALIFLMIYILKKNQQWK